MAAPISLVPHRDVEGRASEFVAVSNEPWLTIDEPGLTKAAGRFVEIVYRGSFWDRPARPVFRFETADGKAIERIGAGPVAGAGIWIGRVPVGTIRCSVSPTCHPGPFRFAIESIRRRSWLSLLLAGWRQNRRSTRSAVLTKIIGWGPESDINLAWAIGSTRLADYAAWLAQRHRPLDVMGLDAPRADWATVTPIHLWIDARSTAAGLDATLEALRSQVFQHWTAAVVSDHAIPVLDDPRIVLSRTGEPSLTRGGFVGSLRPGDRLLPHALACIAEAAHRDPAVQMVYGDEQIETADGLRPVFKPAWSRRLQKQQPFLGGAVFVRSADLQTADDRERFLGAGALPDSVLDALTDRTARPLQRVLLQTGAGLTPLAGHPASARSDASVAIIIPTRDQPAHLRRAVASVRATAGRRAVEIVIIDNGSVEAETKALLATFRDSADVRVLKHPGAFNFSLMCNEGAAATDAAVLVFLNDDTEATSADWLDRLTCWALQPDVGAVGARLVYPDGRLQHIGVVLGMGESAGHFGAFAQPDAPGWARRHDAVHEVAAVTGACLAVARTKFQAVGGFDAVHLPIELSDIDLCLKLAERGWTTLVDPAVRLLHEESASRGGATFRRLDVYESQRAYFRQRWRHVIRDDPYFHPGLSLFNWTAALA